MIEVIVAMIIGIVLGYIFRGEKHPPAVDILTNQVEKLEKDVLYYKKLTKQLSDENMEFRRKQ